MTTLQKSIKDLRKELMFSGEIARTDNWQGMTNPPTFLEILNASFEADIPETVEEMREQCQPMLPWADEHFKERVSGLPLNPPPSAMLWLKGNENYMEGNGKFSHSYPERMSETIYKAVALLKKDPTTRQCVIPMWNRKDNDMALENRRVPCTMFWHFILRRGKLHCYYPMRSCDGLRHFHNDIYLASRLTLWLIEQAGLEAVPGTLTFHAVSFHCFTNDMYTLEKVVK
jgi:thymidylate synthase